MTLWCYGPKSRIRDHLAVSRSTFRRVKVTRLLRGFQYFAQTEAAGGIALIAATAVALVWANSPWADTYFHLWETQLTFGASGFGLTGSLHHLINDGLMAVFFFVVGLEIKREALDGELSSIRLAALPVAAAAGGMIVPALFYAFINLGGPGTNGWGVPMATDIAFALGILALLGSRVPVGLKVFLTALAIVDDLGAVLVIALFYTSDISWVALAAGVSLLFVLVGLNRSGVRHPAPYAIIGTVIWLAFLASGVHATIAGVLVAMTIPARTVIDDDDFVGTALDKIDEFRRGASESVLGNGARVQAVYALEEACEAALPPLVRIEDKLHGIVAFAIIPLFALANAGLVLGGVTAAGITHPVTLGIVAGLAIGKPAGIALASWIVVRAGAADLPEGTSWKMLHAVGWLAGIGFTMSLFVAGLAFKDQALLESAKLGILGASLLAGVSGSLFLYRALPKDTR